MSWSAIPFKKIIGKREFKWGVSYIWDSNAIISLNGFITRLKLSIKYNWQEIKNTINTLTDILKTNIVLNNLDTCKQTKG